MTVMQRMPTEVAHRAVAPRSALRPATDASSAEILATARRWYEADLERCARAHGARWPDHCEWVEAYLNEQLRQRLAARGWRPHDVV